MPSSSAIRRMVRASAPSRSRTRRPTATTSRARALSGSATRRAHRLLRARLERLVHELERRKRAALQGPRDERHEQAAEVLPLPEPGAVLAVGLQQEVVVGVEDAAHPEAAEPPQLG